MSKTEFSWVDAFEDKNLIIYGAPDVYGDVLEFEMHEDHSVASGTMNLDTAKEFYEWLGRVLYS
jgi:hypothetical protein